MFTPREFYVALTIFNTTDKQVRREISKDFLVDPKVDMKRVSLLLKDFKLNKIFCKQTFKIIKIKEKGIFGLTNELNLLELKGSDLSLIDLNKKKVTFFVSKIFIKNRVICYFY